MKTPVSDGVYPVGAMYGAQPWLWLVGHPGHMHDMVWRGICARESPRNELSPKHRGSLNFIKGRAMAVHAESFSEIRKEGREGRRKKVILLLT